MSIIVNHHFLNRNNKRRKKKKMIFKKKKKVKLSKLQNKSQFGPNSMCCMYGI